MSVKEVELDRRYGNVDWVEETIANGDSLWSTLVCLYCYLVESLTCGVLNGRDVEMYQGWR
jgi:hypothetical protein